MCFSMPELDFLGHHITLYGIQPNEEKGTAIRQFPQPTTQRKLRQFLCMVIFIIDSLILEPLKKDVLWNVAAVTAFHTIVEKLADATLLSHPHNDAPVNLVVDASVCCRCCTTIICRRSVATTCYLLQKTTTSNQAFSASAGWEKLLHIDRSQAANVKRGSSFSARNPPSKLRCRIYHIHSTCNWARQHSSRCTFT